MSHTESLVLTASRALVELGEAQSAGGHSWAFPLGQDTNGRRPGHFFFFFFLLLRAHGPLYQDTAAP